MEKIPNEGPALIVYYHGAIPIDYYYFLASVIIQKGRTCHSVADHFLFKIPGFKLLLEVFSVIHGPQEECVRALRNGHLLGISPGGVREALFSAAGSPVSDRPAPADPREHLESPVGEISHQTQRPVTSAAPQQNRDKVCDASRWLRRLQCAQKQLKSDGKGVHALSGPWIDVTDACNDTL
ncbi:Transmembrane protein 68, partial [Larimichthys crocea]